MNAKYLQLLNANKIEELKTLLEEEIKKEGVLKTNSKSRYNALKRIMKRNEIRPNFQGCGIANNKYYFTDSYMYAILNDNCGYEEKTGFPISALININRELELNTITLLHITISDLSYYVKSKTDYSNELLKCNGKEITFDYKFIKDGLDILGTKEELKIYTNQDGKMLIFDNKKGERVVILGKITY